MSASTESPRRTRSAVGAHAGASTATVLPFPRRTVAPGPLAALDLPRVVGLYVPRPAPRRPALVAVPAESDEPTAAPTLLPSCPAPSLRLTRRGRLVLLVAAVVLAAALGWLAHESVPAGSTGSRAAVPATVTVQHGDTLWSIATRLAPQRDARAVVSDLERINDLPAAAIVPGQVLRTR